MSRRKKNYDVLPALSVRGAELRSSLRIVTIGWMFGSVWMVSVGTAAMLNVGYLAGFTELHWGILSATMFASFLAQLPASWLVERTGFRKVQFLRWVTAARFLWVFVGAAPVVLMLAPDEPYVKASVAWSILIIIFASRICDGLGTPAWINWMADLIPARIRGRLFAVRSVYSLIAQLGATIIIGVLLDAVIACGARESLKESLIGAHQLPSLVWALLGIFLVAALCGIIDIRLFSRVREIVRKRPPERIPFLDVIREPMRDRQFIHFAAAFGTLTFGVALSVPFISLLCQRHLGLNNLETMFILAIIAPIGSLISSKPWGAALDRWGRRPILIMTMFGAIWSIWGWLFVPKTAPYLACLPVVLGGVTWQGMNMARLNMEFTFADLKGRSTYSAAANVVCAICGTAGGLLGGILAGAARGLHLQIGPFTFVNYHLVFLISGAVRSLGILWLLGMEDVKAKSVPQVARHMATAMFYSAPLRLVNPVRRFRPWRYAQRLRRR